MGCTFQISMPFTCGTHQGIDISVRWSKLSDLCLANRQSQLIIYRFEIFRTKFLVHDRAHCLNHLNPKVWAPLVNSLLRPTKTHYMIWLFISSVCNYFCCVGTWSCKLSRFPGRTKKGEPPLDIFLFPAYYSMCTMFR